MSKALLEVVNNNEGKTVLIVSHHTAMIFLLKKWCSIKNNKHLLYKDKLFLKMVVGIMRQLSYYLKMEN